MTDQDADRLEHAVVIFVQSLRKKLAAGDINTFTFTIAVHGRASDGDVTVQFELDDYYATGVNAKGGRLISVVEEFLHRKGWKVRNAPLCLPNVNPDRGDDE